MICDSLKHCCFSPTWVSLGGVTHILPVQSIRGRLRSDSPSLEPHPVVRLYQAAFYNQAKEILDAPEEIVRFDLNWLNRGLVEHDVALFIPGGLKTSLRL
jgi:hypothetical protein